MVARIFQRFIRELKAAWSEIAAMAAPVLSALRRGLILVLQILAALILLFEEWGWEPMVAGLAWLSRFRLIARIELFIAGLPPYGALIALALPTSLLVPLKFLAIFLLANGHFFTAGALFVFAKIASTALIARVFILTKPALMQIGWFARAHDWLVPWKDALFTAIRSSWAWRYGRMLKTQVRHETKQAWGRLGPVLRKAWSDLRVSLADSWNSWKPVLLARVRQVQDAVRQLFAPR
jgi:hypothetical protein